MSPVSPVFHTVVTVSIGLKNTGLGPTNGNEGRSLMRLKDHV